MTTLEAYLVGRGFKDPGPLVKEWGLQYCVQQGIPLSNRVIIPTMLHDRTVVGYSGRATDDSQPKYLFSPNYKRDTWLYGLQQEKRTPPILVEGQFDAMALWTLGYTALAVTGAEITPVQASLVHAFGNKCIIYPDKPKPGSPILAYSWQDTLTRLGIYVVLPDDPFPSSSESKIDCNWLMQNDPSWLMSTIEECRLRIDDIKWLLGEL